MIRSVFVFFHRWVGLLMTAFLVIVGVTGSLLAFGNELERLVAPQLFAAPRSNVPRLDLATLAEKAASLGPADMRLMSVRLNAPDRAQATFQPRPNSQTGRVDPRALRHPLEIFVDPWTGHELGRRQYADISEGFVNLVPFIFQLHWTLTPIVPLVGIQILGIAAVLWTIDCFVGFYLTLPVGLGGFWRKWKTSWAIKRGGGVYRLNFDLHRASGLWLWSMLFIFAWSGVMYNMGSIYNWVMPKLFDYSATTELHGNLKLRPPNPHPSLDWRGAQSVGEKLMAEQAAKHGFSFGDPVNLTYVERSGLYAYAVHSSRAVSSRGYDAKVQFDGDTGEFVSSTAPIGEHTGDTITSWLNALHTASVFGLPYKIFVCALGLVTTMLSVTGVYIWWKKRKARRFRKAQGASASATLESSPTV